MATIDASSIGAKTGTKTRAVIDTFERFVVLAKQIVIFVGVVLIVVGVDGFGIELAKHQSEEIGFLSELEADRSEGERFVLGRCESHRLRKPTTFDDREMRERPPQILSDGRCLLLLAAHRRHSIAETGLQVERAPPGCADGARGEHVDVIELDGVAHVSSDEARPMSRRSN